MATIDTEAIKMAFKFGKKIVDGAISHSAAVDSITCDSGFVSGASASHYLRAVTAMYCGKMYHRKISAKATDFYLDRILHEAGENGLSNALNALQSHIHYYREVTGDKQKSFQTIHDKFLEKVRKSQPFTDAHCAFFNAIKGTYSRVTDSQADKQQITVSGVEKALFNEHFNNEIYKGTREDNPDAATQTVRLYETGKESALTIHYRPRHDRSELQLYCSEESGFRPPPNTMWFAYIKHNDPLLNIGFMSIEEWQAIGQGICSFDHMVEDSLFQESIQSANPELKKKTTTFEYPRKAEIAKASLAQQGYECEIDKAHKTFTSKVSGNPYMEAHHLIPISAQHDFDVSLDVTANVVCVCPNCHRLLHHGTKNVAGKLLESLLSRRSLELSEAGIEITKKQLLAYYFPKAV